MSVVWSNLYRFAKYYKNNDGKESRTLIKGYGIRFDVMVFGQVRHFDISNVINQTPVMQVSIKIELFNTYYSFVSTGRKIQYCTNTSEYWCRLGPSRPGKYVLLTGLQ